MQTSGSTAEPRNRAEPRAAWRSRRLAPGYALVIAFLVATLIGWLLPEPAPPPVTPRPLDLRLVTADQSPATELARVPVTVLGGDGSPLAVDAGARIHITSSGEPITVCVKLPKEWSAPDPAKQFADFACWPPLHDEQRADLVVARTETGR
ncbi:hypothetical protein ACWEFJ_19030 [Actinosynnema sp. NPDC004786]